MLSTKPRNGKLARSLKVYWKPLGLEFHLAKKKKEIALYLIRDRKLVFDDSNVLCVKYQAFQWETRFGTRLKDSNRESDA